MNSNLTPPQRLVLFVIEEHVSSGKLADYARLAECTGYCKRQVGTIIRELESSGIISRVQVVGNRVPEYVINWTELNGGKYCSNPGEVKEEKIATVDTKVVVKKANIATYGIKKLLSRSIYIYNISSTSQRLRTKWLYKPSTRNKPYRGEYEGGKILNGANCHSPETPDKDVTTTPVKSSYTETMKTRNATNETSHVIPLFSEQPPAKRETRDSPELRAWRGWVRHHKRADENRMPRGLKSRISGCLEQIQRFESVTADEAANILCEIIDWMHTNPDSWWKRNDALAASVAFKAESIERRLDSLNKTKISAQKSSQYLSGIQVWGNILKWILGGRNGSPYENTGMFLARPAVAAIGGSNAIAMANDFELARLKERFLVEYENLLEKE